MPTVTVEGVKSFEMEAGKKLVLGIEDAGIDILHRCGGNARCTTCRVQVISGDLPEMGGMEQARLARDESFGPIIGIQVVRSDEEALAAMNDTEYGLTAGVYGKSRERAEAILRGVQAGTAYFNCCDRVSPRLPWTGRRHSGIGSTLSTHGIRAFVQPKAWHWRAG